MCLSLFISLWTTQSVQGIHGKIKSNCKWVCNGPLVIAGCKGAQVEEIWSMEPENFENLKYVHACTPYDLSHLPTWDQFCNCSVPDQFMVWYSCSSGSLAKSQQGQSFRIQGWIKSSLQNRHVELYFSYQQMRLPCFLFWSNKSKATLYFMFPSW